MLDPVTQLAYAIQAKPRAYVVLIGSGVSRAAGIPTAWEVVQRLILRLPEAREEGELDEPVQWYRERFDPEIRLATLLEQLAPHPADRVNILASVVGEPTPTEAHKSLARLADRGHIQVFLTTNYDSLMETALYGLNLDPLIIASESEAGGSEPFHQISRPVVFKLHGDYKQPDSMLATDIELRTYRHGIRRLLARALEDYGLIVAGWSGEYDLALRRAIQAVRSRRYPLWYVYRESLSDTIRQVRNLRDAQTIQTTDADSFFSDLLQKVTAIDDYSAPHPREVEALSAELTLLLRTAAGPIAVNSLLSNEIERCFSAVTDRYRFPYTREAESSEEASSEAFDQLAIRVGRDYIGTSTSAATLMAIGCAWSSADYHEIWKRGIERLGNLPVVQERSTIVFLRELRNLPWLLLLYSSCIASIWRGNLSVVRVMTRETSVHGDFSRRRVPLIAKERVAFICCQNASQKELTSSLARAVREREADRGGTFWTPMSELLFAAARGPVSDMIPGDEDYEECFDRTELVLNLVAADLQLRQDSDDSELPSGTRAPGPWPGRYSWRTTERGLWFIEEAENEMGGSSPFWRSVDAELFRNDGDRRNAALDCIKARLPDWTRYGFGNF